MKFKLFDMSGTKHIHFIGICGVAMSALALTFKENGWKVTGSDSGFFPPVSTYLTQKNVDYYAGWHPEKIGKPDLVVVGNVVSSLNPEWVYVKENKIPYRSYPEIIAEFFVKSNSVVVAGTFGKTSSTAMLAWIMLEAGLNPSYMFGGLTLNDLPAAHLTPTDWNVLEGDEYKSARWDLRPKFSHYNPKFLLLTAVIWDHADIYKTEKDYISAFQKLVDGLPEDGLMVVSERVKNIKLRSKLVTYGTGNSCDFKYQNIKESENGLEFEIVSGEIIHKISSPCLGDFMADNITACFAMAKNIGIPDEKILESISTFKGMKRRLEKRLEGRVTVIDDIAHSPRKATSVIQSLKKIYKEKLIVVFEPNTGNRQEEAIPGYDHAFSEADEVVIPRLTKIKHSENDKKPLGGEQLAAIISQTQPETIYIENDGELVKYLIKKSADGAVVAFLGSHGFRGMIEETVKFLT